MKKEKEGELCVFLFLIYYILESDMDNRIKLLINGIIYVMFVVIWIVLFCIFVICLFCSWIVKGVMVFGLFLIGDYLFVCLWK